MKKILALVLTLMMLLTQFSFVATAESDVLEELSLFGIVPNSINSGNLDEDATRGELAYLASRIVSGYAKTPVDTRFTDVTAENPYSGYIEHMAQIGIINGKGDGLYDPQGSVKPEMAAKVLVNLLGYGEFGEYEGGYPNGYMSFANRLGIGDYLIASQNGNLTKGALCEAARYALVTGFNKPEYMEKNGELVIAMTNDKSSLLGQALKISVYTGEIREINPKSNSVKMFVSKNKYDTNYQMLDMGLYSFKLTDGIDCYEFEKLSVTAWVNENEEIIKLKAAKNTEVKYGYIDSVNGKLSDNSTPTSISNISEVTLLDDEEEYSVSENAEMRYNNKAYNSNISLCGKFVKLIINGGEVTFIETWDLEEGGLLTSVTEDVLTFVKGTQKSNSLKELSEYKTKRVFINNKVSDFSFIKAKTVFDYYADGDLLVIVDSEKQIVDNLYTVGKSGLEVGNAIYRANRDVYYSENGQDYKVNNYVPFLNTSVCAYIGPDGNVRYVAPDGGNSVAKNEIYAAVKAYDMDIFGEEITVEFLTYSNSKLGKEMYKITNKTSYEDGLTQQSVLSKAGVIDDTNFFVLEVNNEGFIKNIKLPMPYSGFLGNPKGTVTHIIDSYIARLDMSGRSLYYDTSTPTLALYEKDGIFSAKMLTWDENLRGRGDLASPLNVSAFGDESKSSSPALILITGDITALSSSTTSRFAIVIGKTIGIKEDGTQCVNLQVLEGGKKPKEYSVSEEIASTIPEYALISYAAYNYAPGEQGAADDIVLRDITSGGVTQKAIDLSEEYVLWPEEVSLSSAGFHKGTVDAIDDSRLLTTNDFAAYVDPVSSVPLVCVKYNENNPTKRFEGIEISDIGYGDEAYYYSNSSGLLKCVIKMSEK